MNWTRTWDWACRQGGLYSRMGYGHPSASLGRPGRSSVAETQAEAIFQAGVMRAMDYWGRARVGP